MSEEDSVSIVPEEEVYRSKRKYFHFLKLPLSLLRDFPI